MNDAMISGMIDPISVVVHVRFLALIAIVFFLWVLIYR